MTEPGLATPISQLLMLPISIGSLCQDSTLRARLVTLSPSMTEWSGLPPIRIMTFLLPTVQLLSQAHGGLPIASKPILWVGMRAKALLPVCRGNRGKGL